MMQEPEIERWTAKRKAELIRQIYTGQTSVSVHLCLDTKGSEMALHWKMGLPDGYVCADCEGLTRLACWAARCADQQSD